MYAYALLFVFLQAYMLACSELIFDVTSAVNSFKSNDSSFSLKLENISTNLELGFYYKTDLDLVTFIDKELENVLAIVDKHFTKYWKHPSKPPPLILEFNLTRTVFGNGSTTKSQFIHRISSIVISRQDLSCYSVLIFPVKNIEQIIDHIHTNLSPSIKVVYRYKYTIDKCDFVYSFLSKLNVHFLIVDFEMDVTEFVPSYEYFKTFLDTVTQASDKLFSVLNFNPKMIYCLKLKTPSGPNITIKMEDKVLKNYQLFTHSVTIQLAREVGQLHIVNPFGSPSEYFGEMSLNLTKFIITKLRFWSYDNSTLKTIEVANDLFPTIYVRQQMWKCFLFCGGYINHTLDKTCCHLGRNKYNVSLMPATKFDLILAAEESDIESLSEVLSTPFATAKTIAIRPNSVERLEPNVTEKELKYLERISQTVKISCVLCHRW